MALRRSERIALVATDNDACVVMPLTPGRTGAALLDSTAANYSLAQYKSVSVEWRPLIAPEGAAAVALCARAKLTQAPHQFQDVLSTNKGASGPASKTLAQHMPTEIIRPLRIKTGLTNPEDPVFMMAVEVPTETHVLGELWLNYNIVFHGPLAAAPRYVALLSVSQQGAATLVPDTDNNIPIQVETEGVGTTNVVVQPPPDSPVNTLEITPVSPDAPLPQVHFDHLFNLPDVVVDLVETQVQNGISYVSRLVISWLSQAAFTLMRNLLPGFRPVEAIIRTITALPPQVRPALTAPAARATPPSLEQVYDQISDFDWHYAQFTVNPTLAAGSTPSISGMTSFTTGGLKGLPLQLVFMPGGGYPGLSSGPPSGTWWARIQVPSGKTIDPIWKDRFLLFVTTGIAAQGLPWAGYNYGNSITAPNYGGRTGMMPLATWQAPIAGQSADGTSSGAFYLLTQITDPDALSKPLEVLNNSGTTTLANGLIWLQFGKGSRAQSTGGTLTVREVNRQEAILLLATTYLGGQQSKYCMYYDKDYIPHTIQNWYNGYQPQKFSREWLQSLPGGIGAQKSYYPMVPGRIAPLDEQLEPVAPPEFKPPVAAMALETSLDGEATTTTAPPS